ncbi:Hypothetical predicted protein [Cloeon dipterum]|uniref:Major facilitator superfamily (MFS) profile domain-containing protein n=1 Tax=Cloeon dipterum TaxID=197152 RepID=A0A8S1CDR3_9INSE|nr:Hypothetical predicted protein [Cloeon dipterum]
MLPPRERLLSQSYGRVASSPTTVPVEISDAQHSITDRKLSSMGSKYVAIPPDGGWGWVIVAASFFCNFVVDGIIFSFGMYKKHIIEEFGETEARTALVGSLLSGFYLIAGPFVSALSNRYGFRAATILGAVLGAIGFSVSYFADSVTFLYLSYGIVGGVGFGLIYVPAVIAVGFYFERWRALATGIAVCGSGIGTFLMAPLSTYLIDTYDWKVALLVQAGIVLSCAVVGLLFRPLEPTLVETSDDDGELNETQIPLMEKRISKDLEMPRSASFASIPENSRLSLTEKRLSTYSQQSGPPINAMKNGGSNVDINGDGYLAIPELNPVEEEGNGGVPQQKSISRNSSAALIVKMGSRRASRVRTPSECSTQSGLKKAEAKAMQRDDMYFTGSMQRLPQYASRTSLAYHVSVTRPATADKQNAEPSNSIFDLTLLRSPTFILLCVSGFLTMMGFFVPFMFLSDRATDMGMEASAAVFLVSSIGITNTIGRIVCGLISSMPGINALVVNNIALTIGGIATIFSGASEDTVFQYAYACIFGLAIACFASLRSIILVDLLGLEKLTNAFGLLLLFQGIAASIGAPIAGAFKDMSGSYDATFYLSGGLILVSAIMCYPLNRLHAWEHRNDRTNK